MKTIQVKRVYEQVCEADGTRILVERLWPRGLTRAQLQADDWVKEAAPSDALRRWFAHDPAKWPEFRRRYFAELDQHPAGIQAICAAVEVRPVTLLYSAHDTQHNNAVALREYLLTHTAGPTCDLSSREEAAAVACC